MVYDGFEWKFRGPRAQEKHSYDLAYRSDVVDIGCGKCELCRVERRYSRALRIMLEAESWPESTYFITLTFDNEHLGDGELDHSEWSQFIKNFRQKFCQAQFCNIKDRGGKRHGRVYSKTFKEIKQVMCGEYGDVFGRKHFHGIIFNHSFSDVTFTGEYSAKGNQIFTSESLRDVWKKGRVQVEKVTFDLALYVGSYITDPMDDDPNVGRKKKQYGRFGNGIGLSWIRKYWRDVLVAGKVKLIDRDFPIPRYFSMKIAELHPEEFKKFRDANILRLLKTKEKLIKKKDGPLRRAKAKGRIFNHIREKRRSDDVWKESRVRSAEG